MDLTFSNKVFECQILYQQECNYCICYILQHSVGLLYIHQIVYKDKDLD